MRPAATVVVRPVADPRATARCLERLRPTLRRGDVVVVLHEPGHPRQRGTEHAAAEPGESAEQLASRVAEQATTPLVADLHADVVVTPHWLDRLAAALEQTGASAAGPRAGSAPPGQHLDDQDPTVRGHSLRDAARLRAADAPAPTPVPELGGFCRLSRREGQGSVVVHAVLVQHDAAPGCPDTATPDADDAPLLSAALIVKDEAEHLATALRAVQPFVDETVVYDTGSTDRTCEIAEALGAVVVRGHWDDDFGAARNRGLAHCSGQWALVVDADEVVLGDPAALRTLLRDSRAEGYRVPIRNLTSGGTGSTPTHVAVRLHRRSSGTYAGRLHEQVLHRRLGRPVLADSECPLVIEHSGYLPEQVAAKSKGSRNVAIAERGVVDAAPGREAAVAAANLARAVLQAEDLPRALVLFEDATAHEVNGSDLLFMREGFLCALLLREWAAAATWLARLGRAGESGPRLGVFRAQLTAAAGDPAGALAALEALPARAVDVDGVVFDSTSTAALQAMLLVRLGRPYDAADRLLRALRQGVSDVPLSEHLVVLRAAGRPVSDLAAALVPSLRLPLLAQCLALDIDQACAFLDALWAVEQRADVLATVGHLAAAMPLEPATAWSARLRALDLPERCPLLAVASSAARSPRDRALAAAAAHAASEPRARPLLAAALARVDGTHRELLKAEVAALAPDLVPDVMMRERAAGSRH